MSGAARRAIPRTTNFNALAALDDDGAFGFPEVYGEPNGQDPQPNGQQRGYEPPGEPDRRPRAAKFALVDWNDISFDPNEEFRVRHRAAVARDRSTSRKIPELQEFCRYEPRACRGPGDAWGGKRVQKGSVVYIAAEGGPGMPKRLAPHKAKHTLSRGQFLLATAAPNLGTGEVNLPVLIATVEQKVGQAGPDRH